MAPKARDGAAPGDGAGPDGYSCRPEGGAPGHDPGGPIPGESRAAERTLGKKSPVSQPAPRDPADTYG
ncbi:hypothetical protein GCM10022420_089850 [Streptomyces iranensis]